MEQWRNERHSYDMTFPVGMAAQTQSEKGFERPEL